MEKSAAKVALVGRDGAALPVYFLSWIQSKLLFQKVRLQLNWPELRETCRRARLYLDQGLSLVQNTHQAIRHFPKAPGKRKLKLDLGNGKPFNQ